MPKTMPKTMPKKCLKTLKVSSRIQAESLCDKGILINVMGYY